MRCVLALLSVLSLAAAQPIQPRALPFIGTGTLTVAAFNATTQTFINSGCVDSSGKWAVLSQLCATFNGELWHYATTPSLSYINLTSTATTTSTASNGSIKTTTIKNPCGVRKLGADAVPTFVCANDLVADKYGDSGYWSFKTSGQRSYLYSSQYNIDTWGIPVGGFPPVGGTNPTTSSLVDWASSASSEKALGRSNGIRYAIVWVALS